MARNWKVGEAARAIQAGNKEDILDIGRRFPLFLNKVSQMNEAGMAVLDCIPDYVTARKIESVLKGDAQDVEGQDDAGEEGNDKADKAPKTEPKKDKEDKAAKADKEDAKDPYAGKTAKELYALCKERKIEVETKQPAEIYIKALKKADAAAKKAAEKADKAKDTKKADDDEWGEEEAPKKGKEEKTKKEDDEWDI